jgi:hypothetical protein
MKKSYYKYGTLYRDYNLFEILVKYPRFPFLIALKVEVSGILFYKIYYSLKLYSFC